MTDYDPDIRHQRWRPKGRRALVALLAACGLGLGVAACGGTESHAATKPQPVAAAPTTVAAQSTPTGTVPAQRSAAAVDPSPVKRKIMNAKAAKIQAFRARLLRARFATPPPVSKAQSNFVLRCLSAAGLKPVSVASGTQWSGYSGSAGKFVYVTLYRTVSSARAQAQKMSAEEAKVVGDYVVSESIAPYPNSPVPAVAGCLSGHPIKKGSGSTGGSNQKHKPAFTF